MGKTAEEALKGDQNTEESGSVFTTENGSLLKDRSQACERGTTLKSWLPEIIDIGLSQHPPFR